MDNRSRGQSLVEFALVLPVLLMIVMGIIETALVIQGYVAVQHAAREAARFASTYQPPQGACMDLDEDGVLQDGINDLSDGDPNDLTLAEEMDPDGPAPPNGPDGYPYCPSKNDDHAHADANETEAEYLRRRIDLIKMRALEAARGLRVREVAFLPEAFANHHQEPGFFGVGVWGFPSFQVDCSDYRPWGPVESPTSDNPCLDHPGIEGGTVRVYVRHNIELLDPLYRQIVEFVPVEAEVQVVNEGVQVGFGDIPPPRFETDPSFDEPEGEDESDYKVLLTPTDATRVLPDETTQVFDVEVTQGGSPVSGEVVSFRTDFGTFLANGTTYIEYTTDGSGKTSVTLESSTGGMATLRAWIGDDGDHVWNGEPSDSATCTWIQPGHQITLRPAHAENVLPEERAHELTVTVSDENGSPVQGATVAFATDIGGFSYSGNEPKQASVRTDSSGEAVITLYGNYSDTATIQAWIDNGNGTWDDGEKRDGATKTWLGLEPYITVSDYEVYAEDDVQVDVNDHSAGTYDLWWCSVGTSVDTDVSLGTVDGSETGINFTIPDSSSGSYVFETHSSGGSCGDEGDLVAQSAEVQVIVARPDLEVEIVDPGTICPESLFRLSAVVKNTSAGPAEAPFEVDFYIDRGYETGGSLAKQWVESLGAGMTKTITTVAWVATSPYEHTIEAYVDPRREIEERNEYNNTDWLNKTAGSLQTEPIKINFQLGSADTPSGYLVDSGESYGDRGNGYAYGWDGDNYETRDRNDGSAPDQRYDTLNHMEKYSDRTWEIELPESEYEIDLVMGDPSYTDQVNTVSIEGTVKQDPDGQDNFDEYSATVIVDDGALTITPAAGSSNAKICFIHITDVYGGECGDVDPEPSPWGEGPCKPPGSRDCQQLFDGGDFEDDGTMYAAWDWQYAAPYPRSYGEGVQSIVLQASQGWPPSCSVYEPELNQTVTIPDLTGTCTETVSTTLVVRGQYLIDESQTGCSIGETVDVDDELFVALEGVVEPKLITTGAMPQAALESAAPVTSLTPDLKLENPRSVGRDAVGSQPDLSSSGASNALETSTMSSRRHGSRKGLLASASLAPRVAEALASEVIHATSFDSDWSGWSHSDNGGSIERTTVDGPHSGSHHVRAVGEQYDNPPSLIRSISTEGFENIQVSYWKKDDGLESSEDIFEAQWYDGAQWHTLEQDAPVRGSWISRSFDLSGTAADDNPNFRLAFYFRGDYQNDQFYLDDISVTGDPADIPDVTVNFSSPDYSVGEGEGAATITATLSQSLSDPVVVNYATSDGTATAPDDYTSVVDTLTFAPGETEKPFDITIIDDAVYETSETVSLMLYSEPLEWMEDFEDLSSGTVEDTGDTAWSVSSGSGTFAVDDNHRFDASDTGGERVWQSEEIDIAGAVSVDVSVDIRSAGSCDDPDYVSVFYELDGSETLVGSRINNFNNDNWETVSASNLTGTTLRVIVKADLSASDEHYYWDNVSVSTSSGDLTLGDNIPATLTIVDNDAAGDLTVDFTSSEYMVREGDGSAIVTATLSAPVTETLSVGYQTVAGSATALDDYDPVSGTLTFEPGMEVVTFTVSIIDDDLYEENESLSLELFDAGETVIGPNSPATLIIIDDDSFSHSGWQPFSINFSDDVDVVSLADTQTTVTFSGVPDTDRRGTWFYLDELECEVCVDWPVPEQQPMKGSIGGTLNLNGWAEAGVAVWAYNQNTDVTYQTVSLGSEDNFPKGTYHFYNIEPGNYRVYSELWVDGWLYWDVRSAEVFADGLTTVDLDLR